ALPGPPQSVQRSTPMKHMITTGAALFALSLQAPVVAAQEASPEPETTPRTETQRGVPSTPHQETVSREIESDTFGHLDKNGDGAVSKDEAGKKSGLTDNWSQYDGNGDGSLDKDEFAAFEQRSNSSEELARTASSRSTQSGTAGSEMPSTRHQEQTVQDDLIGQLDEDGDGAVSQQEAEAEAQVAD